MNRRDYGISVWWASFPSIYSLESFLFNELINCSYRLLVHSSCFDKENLPVLTHVEQIKRECSWVLLHNKHRQWSMFFCFGYISKEKLSKCVDIEKSFDVEDDGDSSLSSSINIYLEISEINKRINYAFLYLSHSR